MSSLILVNDIWLVFCVVLLNVILMNVILMNVILMNVILMNVILMNVILMNVILMNVTLLNVILMNVILMNVILMNDNILWIIQLNDIISSVIQLKSIMSTVILVNVPSKCRSADCHRDCIVNDSAEWHYVECHSAEWHYVECHSAEWHYVECHSDKCAMQSVVLLIVNLLSQSCFAVCLSDECHSAHSAFGKRHSNITMLFCQLSFWWMPFCTVSWHHHYKVVPSVNNFVVRWLSIWQVTSHEIGTRAPRHSA